MRSSRLIGPVLGLALIAAACAAPGKALGDGAAADAPSVSATASSADEPGSTPEIRTVGPSTSRPSTAAAEPTASGPVTPSPASTPASTGTPVKRTSQPLPGCTPDTLATVEDGTLTLATDTPQAPWFTGSDPANGKGFEAAVAADVAERLGYPADHVHWISVPKSEVLADRAGGFDAFIGQVAIPDQPNNGVSYSTGYFDDQTVLVARNGSPAVAVADQAELDALSLVTMRGTAVPASAGPAQVTGVDQLRARLPSSDGALLPLSVAQQVTDGSDVTVVARLAPPDGQQPRQFGMVVGRGSTLAPCVSAAIDTLRIEGVLTELAEQWLPGAKARELAAS